MKPHQGFAKNAFLATMIFFISVCQAAPSEDIIIDRGGVLLKGKFFIAQGVGPNPTIVLLSSFPGSRSDVLGLGQLLSETGINVLTFNYSGVHESQGLVSFDNQQKDIQAALDFVIEAENIIRFSIDTNRIYLGGWCHGGGMALAYSVDHPEITSVFSIVGNDFGEFLRQYVRDPEVKTIIDEMHDDLIARRQVRMAEGALPKEIAEAGLDKLNPIFDLKQNATALAQKDILLVCAWDDEFVTVDQYMLPLYRAIKSEQPKNLQIAAFQDGHSFAKSRKALASQLADWIIKAPERIGKHKE